MSDRADGRLTLPDICCPCVSNDVKCGRGALWSAATACTATRQNVQSYIFHMIEVQPVSLLDICMQSAQLTQCYLMQLGVFAGMLQTTILRVRVPHAASSSTNTDSSVLCLLLGLQQLCCIRCYERCRITTYTV